jgi:hypothetical protein
MQQHHFHQSSFDAAMSYPGGAGHIAHVAASINVDAAMILRAGLFRKPKTLISL